MPFTLSHPAAVLPFVRWTPKWLSFAAMVIGSLTPDVSYFFPRPRVSAWAHTFPGSFAWDLPVGIVLFGFFLFLREPLCRLLPSPNRELLLPLAQEKIRWSPAFALKIGFSVLLGVWTHTLWDSFTHQHGFFVERIPALSRTLFVVWNIDIPCFWVVQHISTFAGLGILIGAYIFWLRSKGVKNPLRLKADGWRYALWSFVLIIPIFLSGVSSMHMAWRGANLTVWYSALCHFALYYMGFLFFVLLFLAVIFHAWSKNKNLPIRG
ncbi:MAG: DUF4184 family protein [Chthoniobacterales bacterium]